MSYTVINTFIDNEHKGIVYHKGDVYPKDGFATTLERVAYLQSSENQYKKAFIGAEVTEEENTVPENAEIDSDEGKEESNTESTETEKEAKTATAKRKTTTKK